MVAKDRSGKAADAAPEEKSGIRTIHVAARILSALADYNEPVRVTDLARRLKITMPTISRHLATWRALGFVDKPDGQETYRLNMKVVRLANAAIKQNDYASIAQPYLLELRDTLAETIVFCTKSGNGIMVLSCLDSGRSPTVVVREGSQVELPYSPAARLILAFSEDDPDQIERIAETFDYNADPRWNANTFKRRVRRGREEWYDLEVDLAASHIGAIAAPVFDHSDKVIGAVSIIRPSSTLQHEPSDEMIAHLKNCCAKITAELGSAVWDEHCG
ncbi:MAG: IclR family transcriptional regulator [Croceibacterium sp.]